LSSEPFAEPSSEALGGAAIAAVVWDFGGVLITPITGLVDEVAAWHGVTMSEMLEVLLGPGDRSTPDHPWHRAERGEIPTDAMQAAAVPFAEAVGLTLRGDEYERLLCGEFVVRDDIVQRVGRLRQEGFRTGLLTNSFKEFRPIIEQRVPFEIFDVVVDSSEVGLRKPDPEIFDLTTERLGVRHDEVLYLDDFAGNVAGARAAGWRTIHVTGGDHIIADLDAALAESAPRPVG
jgi:putative hydrolase of the HAD superfamily